MLIVPRGRPLIVASRLPDGVDTPGSKLTKSIALRLVIGSLEIWLVLIVVDTVDDWVCTISDEDETVTCSETPPTSIEAFTFAPAPDVITTFWTTTVLKPWSVTVTV